MPSTQSFSDPKAYHLLSYGTLLGSNLFQTFMNGPIAFKALPRPSFSTLQQAIFPPYFVMQTALPIVLALTWPGERVGAVGGAGVRKDSGWAGILARDNFYDALLPVALMFGTSLMNLVALGPATTKVMRERKHQETRDGKRYYEHGPHSDAMKRLNKSFSRLHGASSAANLLGTFAMLWYGLTLAEKLVV